MLLDSTKKIILGSVVVLGVLTTGLSSYHLYRKPTTIGQVLWKEKELEFLNDDKKWEELAKKHFLIEKQEGESLKKINGLVLKTKEYSNPEIAKELKEKCESLWNTELSKTDESNQKRIKEEIENWCVSNAENLRK